MMEAILTAKPSFPNLTEKERTSFRSRKKSSSPKYVALPIQRNSNNIPHSPRKTIVDQARLDLAYGHVGNSSGQVNSSSDLSLNGWDKAQTQHPQYQGKNWPNLGCEQTQKNMRVQGQIRILAS